MIYNHLTNPTNSIELINSIKQQIKSIDIEIDNLLDAYNSIQASRKLKNLSLAIYACNDIKALKCREINININKLETKQDSLRNDVKALELTNWSEYCMSEHEKFINNKYMVVYNKDILNKIYTSDSIVIENLKEKSIAENINMTIFECIEYNNKLNKAVNIPQLINIYEYRNNFEGFNYCGETICTTIPNQAGYKFYLKEWRKLNGELIELQESGYNKNNENIMNRIINQWGTEVIYMNNTSIMDNIAIHKEDNYGIDIKYNNVSSKHKNKHSDDIKMVLENTLLALSKNKDYNYNIEHLKNFMSA